MTEHSATVIPAERLEAMRRERERERQEQMAFAGSILESLTADTEKRVRVSSEPGEPRK